MQSWRSVPGYSHAIFGWKVDPSLPKMRSAKRLRHGLSQGCLVRTTSDWKHEKSECMVRWVKTRVNDHSCKQQVQDSENGKKCMCVKWVAATMIIQAKQCHACDNSEMQTKTEVMLGQASMNQNNRKHSLKSSRQHSYKAKHKKCQKWNARYEKRAYPKTNELNVPTNPRCNVGCQSCKIDVRNELCIIQLMSFDKIEVATRMP